MLKIAICDDDERSLRETKNMLERWSLTTSTEIDIDCLDNGDALIGKTKSIRYDIVFLDIFMPLLNGMEAAQEIRERDKTVKIIFLTSSPDYALQSYSVKATDYCLKPIEYQRLKEIMDNCAAFYHQVPDNLILKTMCGYQKVYLHEIEYIEAQNKHVSFFLKSGKVVEVVQPLYTFETSLSINKGFFKCHRSYLVYLPNVDFFNTTEIKTKSGRCIPIARGCYKAFHDAYFDTMFKD